MDYRPVHPGLQVCRSVCCCVPVAVTRSPRKSIVPGCQVPPLSWLAQLRFPQSAVSRRSTSPFSPFFAIRYCRRQVDCVTLSLTQHAFYLPQAIKPRHCRTSDPPTHCIPREACLQGQFLGRHACSLQLLCDLAGQEIRFFQSLFFPLESAPRVLAATGRASWSHDQNTHDYCEMPRCRSSGNHPPSLGDSGTSHPAVRGSGDRSRAGPEGSRPGDSDPSRSDDSAPIASFPRCGYRGRARSAPQQPAGGPRAARRRRKVLVPITRIGDDRPSRQSISCYGEVTAASR